MTETVAILDYGMGNLHSVAKALEKVASGQKVASSYKILVTSDPTVVATADRVIFPGVGAIRDCLHELRKRGLDQAVREAVSRGTPVLGVCVGMQALMSHSEENGGIKCLGVFPGEVVRFTERRSELGERLKVPHMGWNQVRQVQPHPMWAGLDDLSRFYFVHSYHVTDVPENQLAGSCDYGIDFPAAVCRGNVFAVQFHPEKSASHGLILLENFLRWAP